MERGRSARGHAVSRCDSVSDSRSGRDGDWESACEQLRGKERAPVCDDLWVTDAPPGERAWRHILGFLTSQAVCLAAELALADHLAGSPLGLSDLAAVSGADAAALGRVLRHLESVGFFEQRADGRYANTPMSDSLRKDAPGSQRDFAVFVRRLMYPASVDLLGSVRSGGPAFDRVFGQPLFGYLSEQPDAGEVFSRGMASAAALRSQAALSYPWPPGATVVDVGGSDGAILTALLLSRPDLTGIVFDLPHVASRAHTRIEQAGLSGRCQFAGGDFFGQRWPAGDVYLLSGVIHDWDDESALRILENARRAVPADGRLVLLEVVLPATSGFHPGKVLDLVMLTMTTGYERADRQWRDLLGAARFEIAHLTPSARVSLIEARPA